jgi:dCTP deaminase
MSKFTAGIPGAPLPDHRLDYLANEANMIQPFVDEKRGDFLSYGLSSYGYDVRLGNEFASWTYHGLLDPAQDNSSKLARHWVRDDDAFVLDAGGFILAHTLETLDIPSNVVAIVHDKSTYARLGIAVQNTVLEPGWRGQVTLEITNHAPLPVKLYPGRGIAQILFYAAEKCESDYGDKGRYQDQSGVVAPR